MIRNTLQGLFTITLIAVPAAGQNAASTLVRLTERSHAIVQARALQVRTHSEQRRVLFKVQQTWKGERTGRFEIAEPSGQACGRALHGVITGASYLVFLTDGHGEVGRLTVASSRSVIDLNPDVLAHVCALVKARSAPARSTLLVTALGSRNSRVRRDAALALPIQPGLETASVAVRDRIVNALRNTLGSDDYVALGLIRTVSRLHLRAAAPVLLRSYLDGKSRPLTGIMRSAISNLDSTFAVHEIERGFPADSAAQARAIALLERCPGIHAEVCLERLSTGALPAVAVMARQSLARRTAKTSHLFRAVRPRHLSRRR